MPEVVVLLSVGRHPASGRPRPADLDARALLLGLRMAKRNPNITLRAVHAGPDDPALRAYLGMGLEGLTRLDIPFEADPMPALADHLGECRPSLVLTGMRAECGEASGFLPYALAERLDAALLPAIMDVELNSTEVTGLQALPGGRRRRITAPFPAVVTVADAAPEPRQSAFARARRGTIDMRKAPFEEPSTDRWTRRPPRSLAKPLAGPGTVDRGGDGATLTNPAPDEAARAILAYLRAEGMLPDTQT